MGVLLGILIESSSVLFSRRLRRSRREECSRLHYIAEKDRLFEVKAVIAVLGFCCFGFRLRKSARSAGDFGVSFVLID